MSESYAHIFYLILLQESVNTNPRSDIKLLAVLLLTDEACF